MKRSIGRITNIIEDMLAYSKEREPMLEGCSLTEIIDDAFTSLEPLISRKSITIEKNISVNILCKLDGRSHSSMFAKSTG